MIQVDLKRLNEMKRCPTHPGDHIKDYMGEMSETELASKMQYDQLQIVNWIEGRSTPSISDCFKLATVFDTSPDLWINLKLNYEIWDILHN